MVLVSYKPISIIVLAGPIIMVIHFLQAARKRATLPGTEDAMATLDFITALFCQVDEHLLGIPEHPHASDVRAPTALSTEYRVGKSITPMCIMASMPCPECSWSVYGTAVKSPDPSSPIVPWTPRPGTRGARQTSRHRRRRTGGSSRQCAPSARPH